MLTSLLLTLVAERDGVLPSTLGRANYAATLARLNELADGLGDRLHADNGPKPLTCSDLFPLRSEKRSDLPIRRPTTQLLVRTGDRFHLHLTGLTPTVSQALLAAFVAEPPTTLTVSNYTFQVEQALCDAAVDGWTGVTTYEALAAQPILGGRPFAPQLTLAFLSPTSFESNNLHIPLPLPNLVFGSLVDRWNRFSPLLKLAPELRQQLLDTVAISQYELRSAVVPQKSGADGRSSGATPLHIGAEGYVTYIIAGKTHDHHLTVELTNKLQTLANFAMYSGVGVKTTTGMGQCRRIIHAKA